MASHSPSVVCNNTKHSVIKRMYRRERHERATDRGEGVNYVHTRVDMVKATTVSATESD